MRNQLPGDPSLPAGLRRRDLERRDAEADMQRELERGDMLRDFDKEPQDRTPNEPTYL